MPLSKASWIAVFKARFRSAVVTAARIWSLRSICDFSGILPGFKPDTQHDHVYFLFQYPFLVDLFAPDQQLPVFFFDPGRPSPYHMHALGLDTLDESIRFVFDSIDPDAGLRFEFGVEPLVGVVMT